ncbi:hypothetical protein P20495_1379 [Pseudoalteromonas sp. BSi20495]|nr:hypothetical protein P20495_1379 [Pseudoalteromonas sp. BSi20495]
MVGIYAALSTIYGEQPYNIALPYLKTKLTALNSTRKINKP